MATLEESYYYLDDWEAINESYLKYLDKHFEAVDCLQQWCVTQPHLPPLSRSTLGMMYHWAGEEVDAAKNLIDNYLTHRTKHPEFFKNRCADPDKVDATLNLVEAAVIEPWERRLDDRRLVFVRIVDNDPSKLHFHQAMQVFTAVLDFEIARQGLSGTGLVVVLDMAAVPLGYLTRVNLIDIAVTLKYAQMFERRVHKVHIINCYGLITQIMTVLRPFLSKDLSRKIHFHKENQMDGFFKHVPKEYVPSTYGGALESMAEYNAEFRKRFKTSEPWLRHLESTEWQVQEHLRPIHQDRGEKIKLFFRNLSID